MLLLVTVAAAGLGHVGAVAAQTLAARGYLLDLPGAHRVHAVAIPRGGGAGFAVAWVLLGLLPNFAIPQVGQWQLSAGLLAIAVALVAIVGWIDDLRGLAAWPRLAVHVLAGAAVGAAWWVGTPAMSPSGMAIGVLIAGAASASINLHNFFDGADGLLATQALFVLTVFAWLALGAGHMPLAIMSVAMAGAIAAFLPHNAPRARVFMGDVGSGTIGLAIAAVGVLAVRDEVLTLPVLLLLVSGCLIDTGMTLAARILHARRFWRRHHEHLYQWLVRTGWSHSKVVAAWLAWNLAVVLPAVVYARREPAGGWLLAAIVYAFGMLIWVLAKRRLRSRPRGVQ